MLTYDSDDNKKHSPRLEPLRPRLTPEKSPGPSMTPASQVSRGSRRSRGRNQASLGDAVLWLTSEPNRPDIAREAGQKALMSGSEDEETSSPSDDVEAGEQTRNSGSRSPEAPTRTSTTNTLNADLMNANLNDPSLPSPNKAVRSAQVGVSRGKGKDQSDSSDTVDYGAKLDGQPPRKRASLNDKTPVKALQETDSIQASPTPLPHILSAPTAPYFTDSPAPSRSATMQDSRPVQLPPVKNLLNMVDARKDQDIPRSHAMTIPIPPADAITTGPPLSATFSSSSATPSSYGHQRERSRTGSLSSAAALYPPGSAAGQKRPFSHQSGSIGLPLSNAISPPTMTPTLLPESSTQGSPASDENARSMTGDDIHRQGHASYKCDFPGCTASPFITQYLLNSHRNVHSDERPYYCSLQGCPRSRGGKGFKRRNEMLRHGLVHDSPGFICPFCGDGREHRYPRPDNLLRHVRMHHKEENIEDERLRQVLVQRRPGPAGGGRGRRRRDTADGPQSSAGSSRGGRGGRTSTAGRGRGDADNDGDEQD